VADGREFQAELANSCVAGEPSRWPLVLGGVLIALGVLTLIWSLLG
jgi:hypothetical protein